MDDTKSPAAKEFLVQLREIVVKTEELSNICPFVNDSDPSKQLKVMVEKLEALPESEIIDAHNVLVDLPSWQLLPKQIDEVIENVNRAVTLLQVDSCKNANGFLQSISAAQTNCTLGNCPSGPSQVQVDNLAIGVAAADLATATATLAAKIAGIFSDKIGKVLEAVAAGLDIVAKGLALGVAIQQRAADVVAECEDAAVKQLLLNMCYTINGIDKKIDNISGKIDQINQKLDEVLKIVNEIKAVVDEILLHQIEEALAECELLVALYLPSFASGSIDKVQTIVENLIDDSKLAGRTTANAEAYMRQGNAAIVNGEYEKALEWYMLSYKQLQFKDACSVPCPSEPCGDCQ